MENKSQQYLTWFGYAVASIVIVVGVITVAGLLMPGYVPDNFRYLFGAVFILYGIFRIVTLWTKNKRMKEDEE